VADDFSPATKFRLLSGLSKTLLRGFHITLTLVGVFWGLGIDHSLEWTLYKEQYLGFFLALGLGSVFLGVKARVGESGNRVPWYDWALAGGGLLSGLYVTILYPTLVHELGVLSPERWLLGGLAILLILEATRRVAGWALVWVALACILYAKFAYLLPGLLYGKGASWPRIATYLYLDANGLFGLPLLVAATIVVAFILFGQALYAVGGDKFLTDLSLVGMGRYRGGPAKVAIVSSSLFGTVSGSAVANVVVDGALTIPMMKRGGYPPHLAAAIEAVASNGGQIMPPVMGTAAFLIAEFLNIPYGEVALAAFIPACLYYLALFTQVDLEAAKLGLSGLPPHELPRLRDVTRRGWVFLIPLILLIYTLMFASWEAEKAGMAAVIATFLTGILQRETRPTLRGILTSIEETGRILVDILIITTLAGLVIGSLNLSALTFTFSLLLVTLSGQNLLVLLGLTAIVCIILGLSLPTTVVYITLAVLVGPALAQMGVPPLAAHLFLFYFGMLSLITPPDCLATYTAAAIAHADFWKAGWTGMRLGIAAYVVPFVFVLQPALILKGSLNEIALSIVTASLGVILLSVACAGYLFRLIGPIQRVLFIAAAAGLLIPIVYTGKHATLTWASNSIGLVLGIALVVWERLARPDAAPRPAVASERVGAAVGNPQRSGDQTP
jgi:TRAP transporter 4TM/12TM fusion protein